MNYWTARELKVLRRLRTGFLEGRAGSPDYWRSEDDIALYDVTFAQRIGWKWDAALRAARALGWRPRGRRILDWGCGSGIASRRLMAAWPEFDTLALHDRSTRAIRFAAERARSESPALRVETSERVDRDTLLVLSHVLNELTPSALERVVQLVRAAGEVVWVEAGTHADSRRLIGVRETIRDEFRIVAPCPHAAACGLLMPENAPHWCHHFAAPPSEIFQEGKWSEFSRELNIDLRSLPFSYLILDRAEAPLLPEGTARILGVPRESKGYCRILSCERAGVADLMLQKRDAPTLFKAVLREPELPPFRWTMQGARIVAGEPVSRDDA
jgi:Mitochondrial small ribosomal subunit Rsm22